MELEKKIEIQCPACGHKGEFSVYENINTKIYPDLKEKIKSGQLFIYKCPSCGTESIIDYGLIYQDPDEKILIQYYMSEKEKEGALDLFSKESLDHHDQAEEIIKILDSYRKRLVDNLESLREKIQIFDRGLDDRAVELVKIISTKIFIDENPNANLQAVYFVDDQGKDLIVFEADNDNYAINMDATMYRLMEEGLEKLDLEETFIVDEKWALEVFDKLVQLG
ncbi:MAG: CpXC domain-containing protein [Bacillota bacterium]|nr:CpXC domain-containing protein [Bacillota bacterium]